MPRATLAQTNFSAGELSPRMLARSDLAQYRGGVELLQNWLVEPQGSIVRRPGTQFVAGVKDRSAAVRLLPFIFSAGDAYMLEFGNLYVRFYQSNGQVTESKTVTAGSWTAGVATLTIGTHSAVVGDRITVAGVTPAGYNGSYIVTGITGTTVSYSLTPAPGAWSAGGTVATPFEKATPYLTADLDLITFTQSADVVFLTHPDYEPRKLSRLGATSWNVSVITFLDGPYLPVNVSAVTLQPSNTSGNGITITANGGNVFVSTDADNGGRLVRIRNGASPNQWGYARITAFTSATLVTADVKLDFGAALGVEDWALGAWSETTGYPHAVTFHQQRLMYGATDTQPLTIWGSVAGDFENFTPNQSLIDTIVPDDGVTYTLAAQQVNRIVWLFGGLRLFAGTLGEVHQITGGGATGGIEATSIPDINVASSFGCAATVPPVRIGSDAFYLQAGQRKLRGLFARAEGDSEAVDMTLQAEHITLNKVYELAYSDQPSSTLWGVKGDGELIGMTYDRRQQLLAWHGHILGGEFAGGNAVVESITSIPTPTYDQLWFSVLRTIGGNTERYIEYLAEVLPDSAPHADAHLVDSALIYDGAAATTVTGLEHLEGETLEVLADGATHPPLTVASGQITLTYPASKIIAGLGNDSDAKSLPLALSGEADSLRGKTKKIISVSALLRRTGSLKYGPDFLNLDELILRESDDPTGQAVPLFDGETNLTWPGGYDTQARVFFRADGPQPASVLGLAVEFGMAER